ILLIMAALLAVGWLLWQNRQVAQPQSPIPIQDQRLDGQPTADLSSPASSSPAVRPEISPAQGTAGHQPPTNIPPQRLRDEKLPVLKLGQLENYLRENQRSAGSLLSAFHATQDQSLLQEAEERFPNDPRVALAAATQSGTPAERRRWIEAFKQSAPDNA